MAVKGKASLADLRRTFCELEAELERRTAERDEGLAREAAVAEVLQVIHSAPGDLASVFDALLEKAMRLCGAVFGELHTYDGVSFKTSAGRGHSAAFAEARAKNPPAARPGTASARILETKRPVHILDIKAEESYRTRTPASRALIDLGGTRTTLAVPLLKNDTVLGFINFHRDEVKAFTDKQIALLQNFAAQAVIAMENARLLTETREALEQQTATAEVLGVINSSPGDLAPVFDAILDKAHSLCGAEYGSLFTYDGELFWRVATQNPPPAQFSELVRGGFRPGPGNPFVGVLEGERIVHIADIRQGATEQPDDPGLRIALEVGLRTFLIVPLRKDDALLGAITAVRHEVRPFTDQQIALLQNFAAQAVIAMENARLLGELRQRTDEVAELNRGLEARVAEQVEELGRVGRLKRFLAPQLAELIVSQGDEKILESHRREIVVVFCDLRGYTAFTETAEPEEVLEFLREYHSALGPLVAQFEGTLDQFSGDGIMVFFNDPVPCPDPAERAVKMAMAMREAAGQLIAGWRRHGYELGFGAGIAQGYATLGQIGFSERSGYTAIGTVCNLAARLCAAAKDGQILVSSRIAGAVEAIAKLEDFGNLELKGLSRPVAAFNVSEPISGAPAPV
jgi:adenylate cyclase